MKKIEIPEQKLYDEKNNEIHYLKKTTIVLEHSLISISKWESKWKQPFLSKDPKTEEQTIDYIRCMTLTQNVNPYVYFALTPQNFKEVAEYIEDPMTATWFNEKEKPKKSSEVVTSELIYYWMSAFQIPFSAEKWHLNRLLTLIRIANIKNQPPKKMSKKDIVSRNRALNAERRKKLNTRG